MKLVVPVAVAQLVRPQCRAAGARQRTNRSTLLATNQAADGCACAGTHRDRQLIAVLVPKASLPRFVVVVDAV